MPEPTREGQRRVELYVREGLPEPIRARRTDLTERLEALTTDGAIDGYSVSSWAKRQPVEGGAAAAQYVSFSEWARTAGATLAPFFDTRECYSPSTGEKGEWLVYPALCLAVHDGAELTAVYPHCDADGRTHTVADGIARLREHTTPDDTGPLATGTAD